MLTDNDICNMISLYADRKFTIRELARKYDIGYSKARKIIVNAGFSFGKRRK